jgi:hypothetical protein
MWRRLLLGSSLASVALFGCASGTYLYSPAQQANARENGLPANLSQVPPERPYGNVVIASPGIVRMKFHDDVKTRMLSVRMVITNNQDDVPWKIDTREVRAILSGVGEVAPAYVNTNVPLPVIEVPRGEKRTLDLYYPLPPEAQNAKQVPEFDVVWQVQTGERLVAQRTPFERLELMPVYADVYYNGWTYAPFWWHDPFVPWPVWTVQSPVYWNYMRPDYVAPQRTYKRPTH